MGRIGTEVARRAIAFGMRVLAYDPYLTLSRANALQVELLELDDVLPRADFITVHMPMSDETKGMINAAAFAKMKPGRAGAELRARRHHQRGRSAGRHPERQDRRRGAGRV